MQQQNLFINSLTTFIVYVFSFKQHIKSESTYSVSKNQKKVYKFETLFNLNFCLFKIIMEK